MEASMALYGRLTVDDRSKKESDEKRSKGYGNSGIG